MQIQELLKTLGYNTVDQSFYNLINMWQTWYAGKVKSFHEYRVYNGEQYVCKEKYSLGMAKTVSEDWANYIYNKDTKINVEDKTKDEILKEYFKDIDFDTNMNQTIEAGFASGTSAVLIVEEKDGTVGLDFVKNANMIFPLTWDNCKIVDCCFASYKFMDGNKVLYLNTHELVKDKWNIKNRFFTINTDNSIGSEVFYEGVETYYISDVKRYFIFKPAILNSVDTDNPMGMSIYAGAIDSLKGIDNVYDSYINEFVLGKKRVMVSADAIRISMKNGEQIPVFDASDTTYYMLPGQQDGNTLIKEIDMKLRVQEHKEALQDMLNMLSVKTGMGTKHYSFEGGMVTATEVKSTTDSLYNSMLKHETPLESLLVGIAKSVLYIMGYGDQKISVEFDDSVIHDRNQELISNIQLLINGVISKAEVRSWWNGEDLVTAEKNIPEQQPQSKIFEDEVV